MMGAEAGYFSEPEEDPEEEIEDPEEDPEEDENEDIEEKNLEVDNPKDVADQKRSDIGLLNCKHNEASRKSRKSRWENPQEYETRKRKTRWEEQGSHHGLLEPPGLINPFLLWTDPMTMPLRMRLMEIQKKLQESEFPDERITGERSPSPKPVYNNLGIRLNTREARIKMKLIDERNAILSKLGVTNLTGCQNPDGKKFVKKLFIPQEEHPMYNFIGLILGPKGTTLKKMEKETRSRIFIRGKGSGDPISEDEKLHVQVEAAEQKALDAAVAIIEKLLIPVDDQENHHKRAQLAELAKLRGNYKDYNVCELCKEQGHKKYACPLQDSTFKASCCDLCGSFAHLTSNCDVPGLPQFCKDKSNKDVDPANLYVSFLPLSVDDKRLREMFFPFGNIVSSRIMKYQATGLSKGFGFVKFESASDAADAVKYMNGHKMEGRILAVRVAGLRAGLHLASQTSCNYNVPMESTLPQAPLCAPFPGYSADAAKTEVLNVPPCFADVDKTEVLTVPPYFVSSSTTELDDTGKDWSSYDFCDRIPSLVPNTVARFPGDPDYNGSEYGSYFSSSLANEAQHQSAGTEGSSNFWRGSGFP